MCDGGGWGEGRVRFLAGPRNGKADGEGRHETCPYGGGRGDRTPGPTTLEGSVVCTTGVVGIRLG